MTTLAKILAAALLSLFMTSCNIVMDGVKGEGEIVRKEKTINETFTAVKAKRGLDVVLIDSDDRKVVIEANENLHQYIKVYVEGNTLYVTSENNIYQADQKSVYVSYQALNKITATSGAGITADNTIVEKDLTIKASSGAGIDLKVNSDHLNSSVSSGAAMTLSGKVNSHDASASSGAHINAKELISKKASASASSGSGIKIYVKEAFNGSASSGANVAYYGNPKKVSKNDSSGGDVIKR
ncbi:DUF2807 domain-containing protein [Aquimarina sp. TRL1]|uniref:head GIN domain-containing protein n=1 Tax=Aquimarina sp. (strain TRL1) TaxID=2736252 RepID=UPI0015898BD5|nr:head GIN domain-containing protein [Aquimarina sp. TRL1]QKX06043.1 DUF2807 domain-containing protein [Aquimarina sp. TRL1]